MTPQAAHHPLIDSLRGDVAGGVADPLNRRGRAWLPVHR